MIKIIYLKKLNIRLSGNRFYMNGTGKLKWRTSLEIASL